MGTRHLIAVVEGGEFKIAQYSQWDGYPDSAGVKVLRFLNNTNLDRFSEQLKKCRFLDTEGRDKEFVDSYNANAPEWPDEPDKRTPEQIHWYKTYATRDLGADILTNVMESKDDEILLRDNHAFAGDGLFCEWCWLIDLDTRTFECYEGFKDSDYEAKGRFAAMDGLEKNDGYAPVSLEVSFPFAKLPTEESFMAGWLVRKGE